MFILKKFIVSFFMPLPIFFMLALAGLYLFHTGRRKRAMRVLTASLVWLVLLSYAPFSALLLEPLESRYPKWQPGGESAAYIHVLGYGHDSDARLPRSSQPHPAGLVRIVEGVALYRQSPGAKLVFSGYGDEDKRSNAAVNAAVAVSLGVDPKDIIMLESPRDTAEEAKALKKIVGNRSVLLVTSAAHMPRAMAIFERTVVNVTAAPTDFRAKRAEWFRWPSAAGLRLSETAFHEYLGLFWLKLRNQT